jgi:hypothetical protein
MRLRLIFLALLAFPLAAVADSYYLPIAGSVGSFRTDVRIFNPSTSDSHVTLTFVPVGTSNSSNTFAGGVHVTIPKGTEVAYNDVVSTVLQSTGLGAIYIDADTVLLATERVYAQTSAGTLGQGFRALRSGNLLLTGVMIQLRADASFRTNIGAVNLQNTPAHVTWYLFDKNANMLSQKTVTMQNYEVLGPTSITSGYFFDTGNADLSDCVVAFSSDVGLGVYASVIDNGTTDPTYFAAMDPSGS